MIGEGLVAQLRAHLREPGRRTTPFELLCPGEQGPFHPECRQVSEQQRQLPVGNEAACKLGRAAQRLAHARGPVSRVRGYCVYVLPAGQDHRRRALAPPGQPREAVSLVPDECQLVGDRSRARRRTWPRPRLPRRTSPLRRSSWTTRLPTHTLGQVLVGRADEDLLDTRDRLRPRRPHGQRVVGLELDHRPHHHAQRLERLLQERKLRRSSGSTPSPVL